MNNLEIINNKLKYINEERIRIQTVIDQSAKQCQEIEEKYNIHSIEEFKDLVDKAEADFQKQVQEAEEYIKQSNEILQSYEGLL